MRMLPAAIIASLALSSTAFAGPHAKVSGPPDAVELSGAVAMDLYGDREGSADVIAVLGYTAEGEDADVVGFTLGTGGRSMMPEATAEKLGLKVKKAKVNGGEVKYVVVPQVWLGKERQVSITDLPVAVADGGGDMGLSGGFHLDLGQLGVAWAVQRSAGKVHFAPADQGAALLSAVGGETATFRSEPEQKVQYGKDKLWVAPMPYLLAATVGGQDVELELSIGSHTTLSNDVELPDAPTRMLGSTDADASWQPIKVGSVDLGSEWVQADSSLRVLSPENDVRIGGLGGNAVIGFDIAVDPAGTMAFAPAKEHKHNDPRELILARAQKDLDKCMEPPEDAPVDEEPPSPAVKCAGQYGSLAKAKLATGDLDGALDAWKTVTGDDENARTCTNWMSLGDLQLSAGDLDGAIASFGKASEQYHAWWDMEAYERIQAQKDFDKLKEEEQDAATVRPQPDGCHVADGKLAAAWFAKGDGAKVAEIYEQHLDLDPGLASVYGSELILANELEKAHGPLRMVDHLTLGVAKANKAGLGHLFTLQNDWEGASANYERALAIDPDNASVTGMWVRDLAVQAGPDEALDAARKWMGQRPDSLGALYGVAVAAKLADKDPQFVVRDGDALFKEQLAISPNGEQILSIWSRFLTATGRAKQGLKVATKATKQHPDSALAWLALAEAQKATGEGDAAKSIDRAVAAGAQDPAVALKRAGK